MTICTKCAHFQNVEPGSTRADVWYNHVCRAKRLPMARDPYDGKRKPLSNGVFVDRRFMHCRDINDGNCPLFLELSATAAGWRP